MKILALLGGSDWNDASVTHLVLKTNRPVRGMWEEYIKDYRAGWRPADHYGSGFEGWLRDHNYVRPAYPDELEEFMEP